MKRNIFFATVALFCHASCVQMTPAEMRAERSNKVQGHSYLVDITFNGETHEYVRFDMYEDGHATGSLSHWAGCKYCKEKSISSTNNYSLW